MRPRAWARRTTIVGRRPSTLEVIRSEALKAKTEKGGATVLAMSRGDQAMDAVLKGGKGVLKLEEGWKTVSEVAEDSAQQGAPRTAARMLQAFKAPADEAAELAGKTKELKLADGVYSGDLTADALKERLRFGRRSGGDSAGGERRQRLGEVLAQGRFARQV